MIDGVQYKKIVRISSLDEKILLCPAGMRPMLNAVRHRYPEDKMDALASECVDIAAAARSEESAGIILSLIERLCQKEGMNMAERVASYLQDVPPGMEGDSLRKFMINSPDRILKFLKYRSAPGEIFDETSSKMIEPEHGLRYYQLQAARNIFQQLAEPPHCVMYHAPTGAGKTRTAMSVVTRHLREAGPTSVLWLASSKELVDQAARAFESAWEKHGDIFCMLRLWRGDSPHFDPDNEPERNSMLIAGLQKVAMACSRDANIPQKLQKIVSLVVFDEAHQSIAPTYRSVVEGVMNGGNCKLLGLSATPGRSDAEETNDLAAVFGGKKVTIWSPDTMNPIEYLTEEGYLAHANFYKINVDSDVSSPDSHDGDYSLGYLEKVGMNMKRNGRIIDIVRQIADGSGGHKRVLVFSPSVDSARLCAAMLKTIHGIKGSYAIDASTPPSTRSRILAEYGEYGDKDDVCVIFNYGILTTGFDAPGTSAAVIARPTASIGLYSQMVGRAIRGIKSGGNESADIYTVLDTNCPQFGSVSAAFENWNPQWERQSNV